METMWLKESLFTGMTSNGFKLGTVLTLGWFWSRVKGCSLLYRGNSMEAIDFDNILAAGEPDASQIQPPGHAVHDSDTTYFYVVRRANNCGDQEHSLSAAVKVSIDANGELAAQGPNSIFAVRAKQAASNRAQLLWFYCSLEQESEPVYFKIYWDGGTGQIDYENPISTIVYAGRMFYSYQSDMLGAGEYLFAVKAEDAAGNENTSNALIGIQVNTTSPDAIDILSAETL
ncbi:MAG: hypothetical protein ACYSTJ_07155 [Planctomycetota bacterium]|jgi:hypothetical protein